MLHRSDQSPEKPGDPFPLKTKRDRRRKSANGPAHNNNKRIT